MAYRKTEIFELAKKAIKKHKLLFISDIIGFLPISRFTFYRFFPVESNKYNTLKDLIFDNKVAIKVQLRHKMYSSKSPTDRIALYKLIAEEEELRRLSHTAVDANVEVDGIKININYPSND